MAIFQDLTISVSGPSIMSSTYHYELDIMWQLLTMSTTQLQTLR